MSWKKRWPISCGLAEVGRVPSAETGRRRGEEAISKGKWVQVNRRTQGLAGHTYVTYLLLCISLAWHTTFTVSTVNSSVYCVSGATVKLEAMCYTHDARCRPRVRLFVPHRERAWPSRPPDLPLPTGPCAPGGACLRHGSVSFRHSCTTVVVRSLCHASSALLSRAAGRFTRATNWCCFRRSAQIGLN